MGRILLLSSKRSSKTINALGYREEKIKNIITIIIIGCISFAPLLFSANTKSIDDTLTKAAIGKQEKELKIKYLLIKANKSFFSNDFKVAVDQYLETISLLSNNVSDIQKNSKRITEIKRSISLVYSSWAEKILQDANIASEKEDIKKAVDLADQAAEINPRLKDRVNQLKEKLNRKVLDNKFRELTTDNKHKKKDDKKKYNLSVLFEQGKILFKKNELNKSKDKFEEILAVDPYNSKAIHYLNLINRKIYKDGQFRKGQMTEQRMGEAIWASVLPITSANFTGERIDISGGQSTKISRKDEKIPLIQKLDEIIIPHITFDDLSALDALLFLKDESKRLDPTGVGFNMVFNFPTNDNPEEAPNEYLITLVQDNLTLKQAISEICAVAGIYYEIKKYAVVISPTEKTSPDLITKVFAAEREDFGALLVNAVLTEGAAIDMKEYFQVRDVEFSEDSDASAVYDLRISRLIVRNTLKELLKIKKILEKLDQAVNPQVSIASKFIEVAQTDFEELGFQWSVSKTNSNISFPELSSATRDTVGIQKSTTPNDRMFKFGVEQNGWNVSAMLHALSQSGKTESLSAPRVTTLNGYTTIIKVVTERYFPESWDEPKIIETTANNATTSWLISSIPTFGSATDIGIVLKVTPFVNSDNYTVDLILEPLIQNFIEYNEDYTYEANLPYNNGTGEDVYPVTYTQPMPIIGSRSIKTRLQVYDGDTVVMGGALDDTTTKYNDKIPIMGDIPLIGRFFQSEIEDVKKTNLLIFTTVTLVMPDGTPLRPRREDGRPNFPDKF